MFGMRKRWPNNIKNNWKKGAVFQLEKGDLQSIGTNLLQSIKQFVEIEAELEKEFKNTGGWLKKRKLDEITGQTVKKKMQNN